MVVGLAIIGMYGPAALGVAQRVREIGIRMALGATPADVLRRLLRDGLRPVTFGLIVGLGLALLTLRLVSSVLLGLRIYDPASVVTASAMLLIAACLAVVTASRRASRLSPALALRQD